jgi:hypothetical protein
MELMEAAPGEIPHPGRVSEQRLLSPKIGLRWWRHCGTLSGKTPIDLGFSCRRDYIDERVMSGGGPGARPPGGAARGGGGRGAHHPRVCLPPGHPSISPLDSVSCLEK